MHFSVVGIWTWFWHVSEIYDTYSESEVSVYLQFILATSLEGLNSKPVRHSSSHKNLLARKTTTFSNRVGCRVTIYNYINILLEEQIYTNFFSILLKTPTIKYQFLSHLFCVCMRLYYLVILTYLAASLTVLKNISYHIINKHICVEIQTWNIKIPIKHQQYVIILRINYPSLRQHRNCFFAWLFNFQPFYNYSGITGTQTSIK